MLPCPVTDKPCGYYYYRLDHNEELAIEYCAHLTNPNNHSNNCTKLNCPLYPTLAQEDASDDTTI